MSGFNFGDIASVLDEAKGTGVSFEAQAKKWDNAELGLFCLFVCYSTIFTFIYIFDVN